MLSNTEWTWISILRKVLRCLDFRSWCFKNIIDSSDMKRTFFWHPNLGSIGGGFIPEDARSHISHLSSKSRVPSLADLTGKNQGPYPGLGAGLGFSRPGKFTFNTNISWVLSIHTIILSDRTKQKDFLIRVRYFWDNTIYPLG